MYSVFLNLSAISQVLNLDAVNQTVDLRLVGAYKAVERKVEGILNEGEVEAADAVEVGLFEGFYCDNLKYSPVVSALLATIVGLVALITIVGNLLVIGAFATDERLRLFGNYFILNLAISDLTVGLLIVVYAPYLLKGCWQLTRAGCLAFLFLDYVVPLASAWSMALISLDRYCSVAVPIAYRVNVNTRRAVLLMLVPWLAGALWYGPTVLFWAQFTGRQQVPAGQCRVEFFDHAPYLITSSFVEFVLPFLTVATINLLIYVNIRRRSSAVLVTAQLPSCTTTTAADDNSVVDTQTYSLKAKLSLSRDKKSARSLSILIVVFLVTWAPFEICSFVNPVCNFCIPDSAFDVVFWLLWLNSTINPILYPFLQKRFRVAFLHLLRCALSCTWRRMKVARHSSTHGYSCRSTTARGSVSMGYSLRRSERFNSIATSKH